jgi:hypothetical protein
VSRQPDSPFYLESLSFFVYFSVLPSENRLIMTEDPCQESQRHPFEAPEETLWQPSQGHFSHSPAADGGRKSDREPRALSFPAIPWGTHSAKAEEPAMKQLIGLLIVLLVLVPAESAGVVEISVVRASADPIKSDLLTCLDSSNPQALTTLAETRLSVDFRTKRWNSRRD